MNLKKTTIMKKFLSFIALAAVCGLGFAQNSAIFKAQDLQAKGDLNGAIELLEAKCTTMQPNTKHSASTPS